MPAVDSTQLYLPPRYLSMVRDILHRHLPNAEVWAYGSRVNGDAYDTSDLDLVLRQPGNLSSRQTKLGDVVEAFSESNLPIIVQVVDWARIPPDFHAEIEAKYVVVQAGARSVDPADVMKKHGLFNTY